MLIESQAQKVLSDRKKVNDESTLMDVDATNEPPDAEKSDNTDIEMKDPADEKPVEEAMKAGEADEIAIDIDPKTYCKLGHFHLLLEDYAKGKNTFSY